MLEPDEVASDMFKLHIVKAAVEDISWEVLPPDSGDLPHANLPEVAGCGDVGGTSHGSITRKFPCKLEKKDSYGFSGFSLKRLFRNSCSPIFLY